MIAVIGVPELFVLAILSAPVLALIIMILGIVRAHAQQKRRDD